MLTKIYSRTIVFSMYMISFMHYNVHDTLALIEIFLDKIFM